MPVLILHIFKNNSNSILHSLYYKFIVSANKKTFCHYLYNSKLIFKIYVMLFHFLSKCAKCFIKIEKQTERNLVLGIYQ